MQKKLTLIFTLVTFCLISSLNGQSSINAGGGSASNEVGTIVYAIGQISYHSYSNEQYQISEGVFQPLEIYESNLLNTGSDLILEVYPNPTTHFITVNNLNKRISFQLSDLSGRAMKTGELDLNNRKIDLKDIATGTYLIRFNDHQGKFKHFKIIKH